MDNCSKYSRLVSFVLPHHGREQLLLQTVQSIFQQDIDVHLIEVIVVSKAVFADTDPLPMKLAELGVKDRVRFVTIPPDRTISYGRNHGAMLAQGEYLAFVDSDVRLAENWVTTMVRLLVENPKSMLVSAVQVPDDDRNTLDVIKSSMSEANLGEVLALPGNALFISDSAFNKSEKFPENLETCEDWVFTNSLTRLGTLTLTNESSFVHLGEDKSFSAMFFKEIWRGKSNLGSLSGRKIDLAELPSLFVPVTVLLSPVVALLACLLGFKLLGLAAAVFTFAAPFLYTLRLKARSSVDINVFLLIFFYLVYFIARALGMIKGFIEGKPGSTRETFQS